MRIVLLTAMSPVLSLRYGLRDLTPPRQPDPRRVHSHQDRFRSRTLRGVEQLVPVLRVQFDKIPLGRLALFLRRRVDGRSPATLIRSPDREIHALEARFRAHLG